LIYLTFGCDLDYYVDLGHGLHVKRSFVETYKKEGLKNTTKTKVNIDLRKLKEGMKK
jgi:hypothetical protein